MINFVNEPFSMVLEAEQKVKPDIDVIYGLIRM
jgi:hypothetical protein